MTGVDPALQSKLASSCRFFIFPNENNKKTEPIKRNGVVNDVAVVVAYGIFAVRGVVVVAAALIVVVVFVASALAGVAVTVVVVAVVAIAITFLAVVGAYVVVIIVAVATSFLCHRQAPK